MFHAEQDAGTIRRIRFKNLKAAYAFMMFHPGKKLLFMGQDFGQLREWSEERELDWYLLKNNHTGSSEVCKDLLHMYKKYPALYAGDNDPTDLNGSMQTMQTEAFSAWYENHRPREITSCL